MAAGDEINPLQLENLVRLLPQLPGVTGTSLMAGTVFGEAVSKARHLPLMALVSALAASWRQPNCGMGGAGRTGLHGASVGMAVALLQAFHVEPGGLPALWVGR